MAVTGVWPANLSSKLPRGRAFADIINKVNLRSCF